MHYSNIKDQPVFLGNGPMVDIVRQLPPEMQAFFMASAAAYTQQAVAAQGLRALASTRSDAAAHEAGHAVWYAANGVTVTSIKVAPRPWPQVMPKELGREYWTGVTLTDQPELAWGPGSSVKELMELAHSLLAGGAAELLLRKGNFRQGSAADERSLAMVIFHLVGAKRALGESSCVSIQELAAIEKATDEARCAAAEGVAHVLSTNIGTLHRVSAALLRHDEIDRKLAAELLKDVKPAKWIPAA